MEFHMVLRARSFSGFTSLVDVDLIYLSTNQSLSIYAGQQQVARFSSVSDTEKLHAVIEVFEAGLYHLIAEEVNRIVGLLSELKPDTCNFTLTGEDYNIA